jgi:putative DNA primase/helicase
VENKLDFSGLAATLLARGAELVAAWLPGGKFQGHEYVTGDLKGGPGDSLKVNMNTGKWADFADSDTSGGDLISLYAAIENIKNGEAAKRLAEQVGYRLKDEPIQRIKEAEHKIGRPPAVAPPSMIHPKFGKPSGRWTYSDKDGPLFHVARYETPEGKQFCPWSWSTTASRWVAKGWPPPRPLYGLDLLQARPKSPVMVVEGERCAEAARKIVGDVYVVVSWANGSKAVEKADWSPLFERKTILIWPDNDDPGKEAARKLGEILYQKCGDVKIINPDDRPPRWDSADALDQGWKWPEFFEWAKPRAAVYAPAVTVTAVAEAAPGGKAAAQVNLTVSMETEDKGTVAARAAWDDLGIALNGHGTPYFNVDNVRRVMENHEPLKGLVWFDEFHQKFFTKWNAAEPREWDDVDDINLLTYMQRGLGLSKLSLENIHQGRMAYAKEHIRNEPREWMESLVWDGKDRIAWFLSDCFGAASESEYIYAASKNFWIGLVARIYKAGCKLDNMIVLEGPQGAFKSTALNIIGGKWYAEARGSVLEKDFYLSLQGKLLMEIAELDAFNRAEVTAIKQVISCRVDRYRTPYGRLSQDHPRMSIFAATTNEKNWQRDQTGARRFWPIECKKVDLDRIRADREQLYAEAVAKLKENATWWEMPKEETEREQEARRHQDEWESLIHGYTEARSEITTMEIAKDCLGISADRLDRGVQMRISNIMKILGWDKKKSVDPKNRGWYKIGQEQLL